MTRKKIARREPFDDLVLKVCHLELSQCRDFAELKEGIKVMERNLEETLAALACYEPPSARIRRAAESVKLKAVLLLNLCRSIPRSLDDSESWRETVSHLIAKLRAIPHRSRSSVPIRSPAIRLWGTAVGFMKEGR